MIYALSYETELDSPVILSWILSTINDDSIQVMGTGVESLLESLPHGREAMYIYVYNVSDIAPYIVSCLKRNSYVETDGLITAKTFKLLKRGNKTLELSIPNVKSGKKYFQCHFRGLLGVCGLSYDEFNAMMFKDTKTLYNRNLGLKTALQKLYKFGVLKKLTIGQYALSEIRKNLGFRRFAKMFPELSEKDARYSLSAFFGGYSYLNPEYSNRVLDYGVCIDANSKYGDIICNYAMPFGMPIPFRSEPPKGFDLFIIRFSCAFKLKPGKLPFISSIANLICAGQTYITDSNGIQELVLPSPDYYKFFEHYEVMFYQPMGGIAFKSRVGLLRDYIRHWYEIKSNSSGIIKLLAKKCIVSCYGLFAKRMDENRSLYPPFSVFVSSWARVTTVEDAQKAFEEGRFILANTDSLFLTGDDLTGFKLGTQIGEYKIETVFDRAKFLKSQVYVLRCIENGELVKKISGLPKNSRHVIDVDTLSPGMVVHDVIKKIPVDGGYIKKKFDYTIR